MNVGGAGAVDLEPTALAAFTVHQRNNAVLVSGAATDRNVALVADVGFVNLDRATVRTEELRKIAGAHGFANAMGEGPRTLVGDFKNAVELVGANTLLARHH